MDSIIGIRPRFHGRSLMTRGSLLVAALLLTTVAALSLPPAETSSAQSTLPTPPAANADGTYTVPSDWPLIPSDIRPGHSFRLLFITNGLYIASSTDIEHYNTIVQTHAANGHQALAPYAALFKVVGSTTSIDARDNTDTHPVDDGPGVRIYWVGSTKVADDYADFYDGSWDGTVLAFTNEHTTHSGSPIVWTGSNSDGTAFDGKELGATPEIRSGIMTNDPFSHIDTDPSNPFDLIGTAPNNGLSYYALSPIFTVSRQRTFNPIGNISVPHDWPLIPQGVGSGDRFRLMFMTSTQRDATSQWIGIYDRFVQEAAAATGHEAIRPHAKRFKAVASTLDVVAPDHTETNPSKYGSGAPIYWLNGKRIADSNQRFWSRTWEHWAETDVRYESGQQIASGSLSPWTGIRRGGIKGDHLGNTVGTSETAHFKDHRTDEYPLFSHNRAHSQSRPLYALSAIFEVGQPPPRLIFSNDYLKLREPASCNNPDNNVAKLGPILDRNLATYTVRLRSDPGGDATVTVFDPSDSRSIHYKYLVSYQGRITNQPVGDTSPVTSRRNGYTILKFNSSNWQIPQTVKLNIHCADHKALEDNRIWHSVYFPGDRYSIRELSDDGRPQSRQVINYGWQELRVRVADASLPAQPDDLTVSTAYEGYLQAKPSSFYGNDCESRDADAQCERYFGVQFNWKTADHQNDFFDAQKHFSKFKITYESGETKDEWAYSYVPQPTITQSVKSDAVYHWRLWNNDAPYYAGTNQTGLYDTLASRTNPGDPIYRVSIFPVTLLGDEVPGEKITICVQLVSSTVRASWKRSKLVDCSLFVAPDHIPGEESTAMSPPIDDTTPNTPQVNIVGAGGVTEGGSVTFNLNANPAPTAELQVNISITTSGDFGYGTLPTSVTIPTSGSATVNITTTDDNTDEPDGSVTLTLNPGDGYTVGQLSSEKATVTDDDQTLGKLQTPEISISGGSGITEGGSASFTLSASPAPASNLDVKVTVSQSGDYGATTGQRTVTVPTTGSVSFTVDTTDDSTDETDGSVTATVDAASGYTVSSSQGAATVSVADNDDATPDYTDYQTLVDHIIEIRDNPVNTAVKGHPVHIRKWNQVLAAIGYDSGVEPMDESQIHANAAKWPESSFKLASD